MENIQVNRDREPFAAIADQKNGDWLLTIDKDSEAVFYRKNGKGLLVDTEIHTSVIDKDTLEVSPYTDMGDPPVIYHECQKPGFALDFEVKQRGDRYYAYLNRRNIAGYGSTEHEAIQALINYCVELACAGSLDTTGSLVPDSPRRYAHYAS